MLSFQFYVSNRKIFCFNVSTYLGIINTDFQLCNFKFTPFKRYWWYLIILYLMIQIKIFCFFVFLIIRLFCAFLPLLPIFFWVSYVSFIRLYIFTCMFHVDVSLRFQKIIYKLDQIIIHWLYNFHRFASQEIVLLVSLAVVLFNREQGL